MSCDENDVANIFTTLESFFSTSDHISYFCTNVDERQLRRFKCEDNRQYNMNAPFSKKAIDIQRKIDRGILPKNYFYTSGVSASNYHSTFRRSKDRKVPIFFKLFCGSNQYKK